MSELGGRVLVLLDNGSEHGALVAKALAEAGAAVVTVHGQGRAPEGRGHLAGEASDPLDVEAAVAMATELFGPVDAVVDVADVPAEGSLAAIRERLPEPD